MGENFFFLKLNTYISKMLEFKTLNTHVFKYIFFFLAHYKSGLNRTQKCLLS